MKRILLSVLLSGGVMFATDMNAQTMLYGITTANTIITISDPAMPSSIGGPYTISGVVSGQMLVGISSRPDNGWLYALGYDSLTTTSQLYTITHTGTTYSANTVGSASTAIDLGLTNNAAMGFITTMSNQLRIIARNGNNYVINADNGVVLCTGTSGLSFALGDIYTGTAMMGATGYVNSFFATDATQEVGYDITNNVLVNMDAGTFSNSFNNSSNITHSMGVSTGVLFAAGSSFGMDTWYDTITNNNILYLTGSTSTSGNAHLYKYSWGSTTGALADVGAIGTGSLNVRGIAFSRVRVSMAVLGKVLAGLSLNMRNLIYFDSYNPQNLFNEVRLNGMTTGQSIIAIDYSANGTLYGFGYNSVSQTYQLYKIDTITGNVTAVNTTPISLGLGTDDGSGNFINAGFRFMATDTSKIRITGNNGIVNKLINASTGAIVATDTAIQYITGDVSFGTTSNLTSIAYTGFSEDSVTQMFGFDANTGAVVKFDAHNSTGGYGIGSSGYINTELSLNSILSLLMHTSTYNNSYLAITYDRAMAANLGFLASNYSGDSDRVSNYSMLYNMTSMMVGYHKGTSGAPVSEGRIGTATPVKDIAIKRERIIPTIVYNTSNKDALFVYPNPVGNTAHIVFSEVPVGKVHIDIEDMKGHISASFQFAPGNIIDLDMSRLPIGLYNVRVLDNAIVHNFMLVKQ